MVNEWGWRSTESDPAMPAPPTKMYYCCCSMNISLPGSCMRPWQSRRRSSLYKSQRLRSIHRSIKVGIHFCLPVTGQIVWEARLTWPTALTLLHAHAHTKQTIIRAFLELFEYSDECSVLNQIFSGANSTSAGSSIRRLRRCTKSGCGATGARPSR